ncbi:FtsQ-type POTRA domain-containing protein [Pusillimonas sp. TS35]|uniref:cell division protein FtsQ/DivIB n=1 Tax=Paracandidimonas lactea TaxID=2895524 RepID=UPI0013690812|nr:cell division protein FtsQ/DivIB [Paracandidimonas lactea]MYN14944.1 FtsQ-type POTRA domain-containing protein [Pusillimonas sp. TS35]
MFSDARLTNFIANALAVLAVFALLAGGVAWLAQRPYFAISRIQLEPEEGNEKLGYVSPASVRATIAGRMSGNFFSVKLDDVRGLIETVPWVRHASVRRVWPDTLRVQVEEQQPLALWNEDQMINTWGEAFAANQGELPDDAQLPQLNGPANSERLVVQRYAEIARWFAPLNLHVREVTLSPRYAWEVRLSDGMRLNLGRDPAADVADPHGRSGALPFAARIEQFVQVWPQLAQRLGDRSIASADLRYPNGFAITLAPVNNTSTK